MLQQENELRGLGPKQARALAAIVGDKNGLMHPFPEGIAGKGWFRGFRERHKDLVLRKPESLSLYRAEGFNKFCVQSSFDLLEHELKLFQIIGVDQEEERFSDDRKYNVDETCFSVNPKHQSIVISKKGKRRVGQLTTSDRGKTVTAALCVSAAGKRLPPFLIFSRKKWT